MPIHILPKEIASQISAGEVVERPASVVKELVENSLDANAGQISIVIEQAGRKLIEVADDGDGIPSDELELAVHRHATSKLKTAQELFSISSLGFRGEALASIASVSRFVITSKSKDEDKGAYLKIDGGKGGKVKAASAAQGTIVRVEGLFYNVPARLKFLKKDVTEKRRINALINRYAVAYPNVRFSLVHDSKRVLQTSGQGDSRENLASLYTADIARQMLEVNTVYNDLTVTGFISPTSITRASRREITFFVNGRWVQNTALNAAIVQAYRTMLMVGRFPIAIVFLNLLPDQVDINVHPAKSEIRFRERERVFSGVQRAVKRALLAYSPVPEIFEPMRWSAGENREFGTVGAGISWRSSSEAGPLAHGIKHHRQDIDGGKPDDVEPQTRLPTGEIPLLRLVGQVGAAYLVAEGPDGLYLVDQHAAHERVLYEKFLAQGKDEIPTQALLEPVTVEFTAERTDLLSEQLPMMEKLGFQVEHFGPQTFIVRGMPALLLGSDPEAALRVVIEDFEEDETPLQEQIESKLIARVCKRAAVKAGQSLSPDEQKNLLRDLEACQSPRTCPHGRPTMIHLSIDLLENQFGRKGPR